MRLWSALLFIPLLLIAEDFEKDKTPLFSFGAIADCQYCDGDSERRRYRLSPEKLQKCVDHLNTVELSFVVHLGDFIDKHWESFDVVVPIYQQLKAPHYHVLGNHDFSVADDKKLLVPERLGMPSRYHSFEREDWRFIIVDGNDLSLYAHPKGSERHKESVAVRETFEKKPPHYNGGVGDGQIKWLRAEFKAAEATSQRVVLFCHFPIFPKNGHNLWNDSEVTELLAEYSHIIAWINGHNHAGNYGEKDGIHYLTLKGMVDTEETSYAIIDVYSERLEVRGFGRESNRTLEIPRERQAADKAWQSLFDGKTLDGWIQKNGTGTYQVKDGTIVGETAKGSPNSFLCTVEEYGDFELEFDVKLIDDELNSGVQIRSQTKPVKGDQKFGRVNGPQVEIEATWENGAESGYIYGEACGGWMTPKGKLVPHKLFKNGEWNHYRIVAKGPKIMTWINGEQVSDLVDAAKFETHPKGFIGLQVHSVGDKGPFQVAWRDIKIKVLD